MSAPADGFARDALVDDGGGLPHRRHLPVVQTKVPAAPTRKPKPYKPRTPRVGARPKTLSMRRQSKREMARLSAEYPPGEFAHIPRPVTRGDCLPGGHNAVRPCPFASCAHHLALDVNPRTGNIKLNFPDVDVADMRETCALDVADRDGATLEEVAGAMSLVRERVRQMETEAFAKVRTIDPAAYAALLELAGIVRSRKAPPLPPDEIIVDASGALSTADALDGLTDIAGARSYEPADDAAEASPLWEVA